MARCTTTRYRIPFDTVFRVARGFLSLAIDAGGTARRSKDERDGGIHCAVEMDYATVVHGVHLLSSSQVEGQCQVVQKKKLFSRLWRVTNTNRSNRPDTCLCKPLSFEKN